MASPSRPQSSPPPSPPSAPPPPQKKKRARQASMLKSLTAKNIKGERIHVEWDPEAKRFFGKKKKDLSSYLGVLARTKISILIGEWEGLEEASKNLLWQDILINFDIPNTDDVRKKCMSAVCKSWRQFKSTLTTDYVFNKAVVDQGLTPCGKYGIEEETWDRFVDSRKAEQWVDKREKAKAIQKKNTTPHRLSRGGYDLLVERMMEEKFKARQAEAASSGANIEEIPPPISPKAS